ncbi:MAG: OmpA family protein [Sphingobacteriaceae bacterium]|nr:OmpA family protein [Sphingobacteriaceae bacterium]
MKDTKSILIILFVFVNLFCFSQVDSSVLKKSNPKQLKRMGKSAVQQHDPSAAISFFEAYLKTNSKDATVLYLLAQSYYEIGDYENAEHYYLASYAQMHDKNSEALYYFAQMQKSNGKYDSARINFQKFKKEYKGKEKQLKKQAGKEIAFCDSVQRLAGTEKKVIVTRLDTTINKVNTEGAPFNLDENTLVFSSLRTEKIEYIMEDDTARSINRKLYYAKKNGNDWKFSGEYGDNFNVPNFNTGNACFSLDRKRIYFTRCKENMKGQMICAIYMSKNEGNTWSEPEKLPKIINNPKYSNTMPTVTRDPKNGNDIIYFVSNNKEGRGGLDIWYTIFDKKKNIYKTPKNAGNKVNSSQDEMSPFFDNETRSLYFSSEGWGGLGGFDVYKASGDGKRWLSIENIGQPVNSGSDDIYYTISPNREEGFFVSNRKGGNTLKNKACCDDIYTYKHSQYIKIILDGFVYEQERPSVPIANSEIEIYIRDKKTKEKALVKTFLTDEKGHYNTTLEAGQEYFIVVKKKEYLGTSTEVSTIGMNTSQEIKRISYLSREPKEPIRIPNIHYEFDKSVILETSKISIDTTVLALMEANPELIVEIQSHTDSKGNDNYNIKLSQRRAESVVTYLTQKGISNKRLVAKGYGESKPIAPNDLPNGADNPEGRALNRRTDFKIIGKLDVEVINEAEVD